MWLHETVGEVIKCMEADVGQSQHIMLSWLNTWTCLNACRSTTLSFTAHRVSLKSQTLGLEQSQCLGLQTSTGGAQVLHLCSTCADRQRLTLFSRLCGSSSVEGAAGVWRHLLALICIFKHCCVCIFVSHLWGCVLFFSFSGRDEWLAVLSAG